jgi:DNA-binding PadR family transcriptional regulator
LPRKKPDPASGIPLNGAVYRILLALGEGPMHGYGIIRWLSDTTEGSERLLPGTLYASLARMVEDGMVEDGMVAELAAPEEDTSGGPPRRYYLRTAFGRSVATAESERLRRLLEIAVAQEMIPGLTVS